jgi:hypothetical protein
MRKTKQDKIVIENKNGVSIQIFEMSEMKKAKKLLKELQEKDLKYSHESQHFLKIINAYWYNGIPHARRKKEIDV